MDDNFVKQRILNRTVRKTHLPRLFKQDPNIVGMGFGKRRVGGRITDEYAAVVYVMKKVPKAQLPIGKLLPRKIYVGDDCVQIDVVETGPIYPHSFTAGERPAPSGISIGHPSITAGTLGCLVTDLTDGTTCILSNNHVLAAENAAFNGDAIIQQGTADGGSSPADNIGTLKRFINLVNPGPNLVDCAIAEVTNVGDVVNQMKDNLMDVPTADHPAVGLLFAGSCNTTIINPIQEVLNQLDIDLLNPGAWTAATIGMAVEKVGRTTEYTTSTIREIDATINVTYGIGTLTFENQITTAWMSDGGDSGSVVCAGGKGGEVDNCDTGGGTCSSTAALSMVLDRDLKVDRAIEKSFRDSHLNNTITGRFLTDTYFENENTFVSRISDANASKEDREFFSSVYDKFAVRMRNIFLDPDNSKERFTKADLKDLQSLVGRIKTYMAEDEAKAADKLVAVFEKYEGKSPREILADFDSKATYNNVVKALEGVASLRDKDCGC
jgi:hypothetical protein